MRVLVTGGCGFIGSALVRLLHEAGHDVRVLDRVEALPGHLPAAVEVFCGDVRDAPVCDRALAGMDAVSHLAAVVGMDTDLQDMPRYAGVNDLGTAVLLAAGDRAGIRRVVLASSMVVYGEGAYACAADGPVAPRPRTADDLAAGRFEPGCPRCGAPLERQLVHEDARLDPRNVYATTKVAQEHLVGAWARTGGGCGVLLRYHNVYGPGLPRDTPYAGVAALFRSALVRGEAPRVFEDGRQMRDFVHVQDVARATMAALERAPVGLGDVRAYNVGSGEPRSVGDMADALADAVDGPRPVVTGAYRLGDVRHVTAASQRVGDELGWAPAQSFGAGMRELADDLGEVARSVRAR
ncbi:MAG: NAD-dependent epimerase/dehydratase family protein [Actinomycetes bacterium]